MGVYETDISFSPPIQFPVSLPKFVIAVWLIADLTDPPSEFTVSVILPNGDELIRQSAPPGELPAKETWDEHATKWRLFQLLPLTPLPLPCEGILHVWVETGREKIRAGRLTIQNLT